MKSTKYPKLNNKKWLLDQYNLTSNSSIKIANLLGCGHSLVLRHLKFHNINRKSRGHWRIVTNDNGIINREEIIEGLMLGDGHIEKSSRSVNPRLIIHQKQKELVSFYRQQLSPDSTIVVDVNKPHKLKSGKIIGRTTSYRCKTKASPSLLPYHTKWYHNNKKVIPIDLILTPMNVLHWFIGDGSSHVRPNKTAVEIQLATNNFTESEVDILIRKFKKLGITFYKSKHGNHTDKTRGFLMRLSTPDASKFYKFIGKSPVKCMLYKWKLK